MAHSAEPVSAQEDLRLGGMRAIEVVHLFAQWGVEAIPAIHVDTDAEQERRFGWDVTTTDGWHCTSPTRSAHG